MIFFTFKIYFLLFFISLSFLLLFKYSCLHFPLTALPHLIHLHLPPSIQPPLALSVCPLSCSLMTTPHYPLQPPIWLLSVCYFNVSGYILFACLFSYPPREHAWIDLENIMLSEIGQVVKDKYHMISPISGT